MIPLGRLKPIKIKRTHLTLWQNYLIQPSCLLVIILDWNWIFPYPQMSLMQSQRLRERRKFRKDRHYLKVLRQVAM